MHHLHDIGRATPCQKYAAAVFVGPKQALSCALWAICATVLTCFAVLMIYPRTISYLRCKALRRRVKKSCCQKDAMLLCKGTSFFDFTWFLFSAVDGMWKHIGLSND